MLPIHLISLERSVERRERARTQLDALCLSFVHFAALDGETGVELFDQVDRERFTVNTGREVRPGEIGCYASHVALWRRCVEEDQPILILEDDFELHEEFPRAVAEAARVIERCGFVRLQWEEQSWSLGAGKAGPFELRRYSKAPQETLCYALSPAAARRFLEGSRRLEAPVDVFLIREFSHGQPMYCLVPFTVDKGKFASDIGRRDKVRKGIGTRAARTFEKIRRQAWRIGLHSRLALRPAERR